MELMQQFEAYIAAQKNVALQFILIGVVLILLSLILQFFGKSNLSNGLKIGALVWGCLILIGGLAYNRTEKALLKSGTELYQENAVEFQRTEMQRMQKVAKDYPVYQLVFGGFILLALGLVFFVKNPFWHGIAFSVMLHFVAVLIVEAYSHQSIKAYLEYLTS